jgi:hypothetical protein
VTQFPHYIDRVSRPISLTDIRMKNACYEYETAAALINDLELMARNAELFNGPGHVVTKNGRKLVNMLKKNLEHEKKLLGFDRDVIGTLEQAVNKQLRSTAIILPNQHNMMSSSSSSSHTAAISTLPTITTSTTTSTTATTTSTTSANMNI